MNKLPGVMIRAGLILLVFGIFRRTTVDTGWGEIHNIGLMQQQTNLILVGAVIFIGGLILKSKKSDDSMISKEDDDVTKSSGLVSRRLNDSKTKVTEISQKLSALSTRVLDRMSEFRDRFFLRLGLAFGVSLLLIGSSLMYALLLPVLFLLLLILSMRRIDAYVAIRKMISVALCLSALGLITTVVLAMEGSAGDVDYITYSIFSLVANLILIFGYYRFKRISI